MRSEFLLKLPYMVKKHFHHIRKISLFQKFGQNQILLNLLLSNCTNEPVLIVRVFLHVLCPQSLRFVYVGSLVLVCQLLPPHSEPLWYFGVVHFRVLLRHLSPFLSRPDLFENILIFWLIIKECFNLIKVILIFFILL